MKIYDLTLWSLAGAYKNQATFSLGMSGGRIKRKVILLA
jgi:hypothetical protein